VPLGLQRKKDLGSVETVDFCLGSDGSNDDDDDDVDSDGSDDDDDVDSDGSDDRWDLGSDGSDERLVCHPNPKPNRFVCLTRPLDTNIKRPIRNRFVFKGHGDGTTRGRYNTRTL
jgi:hypothetical protein